MKKITLIVPIIFFLLLAVSANAQTEISQCPDKCENSTLFMNGIFNEKTKVCVYGYNETCKYGCRLNDTEIFPKPTCNMLPQQDTGMSLEKIYDEINKLKTQVYKNSPSISVHGTEYTIGQIGKIWVQVIDENKLAINNATCYLDIYRPEGNHFIDCALMTFLENGVYHYDFIVPIEVGIYPVIVDCYYITSVITKLASSGVVDTGTTTSGDYTDTWVLDGIFWVTKETTIAPRNIQQRMNFTNVTQPSLQTGLSISWTGIWNAMPTGDSITIYIMNFTSENWIELPNKIMDTGGSIITISNTILTTNATASGLVKNGTISILMNDTNLTDGTANLLKSDYVHADVEAQLSPQYQQIIGSGEIHVSSEKNLPYMISTLCGDVTNSLQNIESSCAVFTDDGEFPYTQGEIEDSITITALETKTEQFWNYKTPFSISCDAVYWLKYYNGTEWNDVDFSDMIMTTNIDDSCSISVPIDLVKGNSYQYRIKADNYIKWEIEWAYSQLSNIRTLIVPYCNSVANASNYTYAVPILNETAISNDIYLSTCHHLFDDFYWAEYFYNNSLTITTAGEDLSYLSELRFYKTSTINMALLIGEKGIVDSIVNIKDGIHFIGGTEYLSGEMGISSIQFIISNNPVEDGNCNITIYYPNGSIFILNGNATYLNESDGIYSYNFTVPSIIGVYREEFVCRRGSGTRHYASGSFHNSNWANNITNIYQLLQYMNSTQAIQFNSLYNLIVSVNSSINGKIDAVNGSLWSKLYSIQGELQAINDNLTLIYNLIGSTNATIMNKLFMIQDEITSVNDTIKAVNQSIESHLNNIDIMLNSIQSDLNQIKGNLTEIKAVISEINVTVHEIVEILGNISIDISELNSSLIAHIDTSLSNLELNLTNLIISVNNTVISSNTTIMDKLYGIQDEIADLNQTIINGLLNISNVTINITTSQQEVIRTMVALFGNQAKNRNYAYLGIGGGLTGFLTGDSGAIYYCKDNMTLAQYSVQNITGSMNLTNIFEDLTHCTYGCVQNACVIPQYMIWLFVLLALVGIFALFLYLEHIGWMSSEE